jgi:hypothetical protein
MSLTVARLLRFEGESPPGLPTNVKPGLALEPDFKVRLLLRLLIGSLSPP